MVIPLSDLRRTVPSKRVAGCKNFGRPSLSKIVKLLYLDNVRTFLVNKRMHSFNLYNMWAVWEIVTVSASRRTVSMKVRLSTRTFGRYFPSKLLILSILTM